MTHFDLPTLTVSGSPGQMGQAHGESLRSAIQAFVSSRLKAAKVNLFDAGVRDRDLQLFRVMAKASMDIFADWDAASYEEHCGIAAGADVDALDLFAASNLTDMRDVLICPHPDTLAPDAEGCTAALIPPNKSATGSHLVAQTWDLNPSDVEYVYAIHRLPDNAPESWSITCAGSLSLVGMNSEGVTVGTTNIKTKDSRPGVGYLNILHKALAMSDHDSACEVVDTAPRAGAHHYWVADAKAATLFSCSAHISLKHPCTQMSLTRTNHCIDEELCAISAVDVNESTLRRKKRIDALLAGKDMHTPEDLRAYLADRSDGVESINRYHEDGDYAATNSCMVGVPSERKLLACRGPADRGIWQTLAFEREATT